MALVPTGRLAVFRSILMAGGVSQPNADRTFENARTNPTGRPRGRTFCWHGHGSLQIEQIATASRDSHLERGRAIPCHLRSRQLTKKKMGDRGSPSDQSRPFNRHNSEDMVLSDLPWEAAAVPGPLHEYEAMRVQWTSTMLASKLSQAGAIARPLVDDMPYDAASPNMSPSKVPVEAPSPDRQRSHHLTRPALLISPDSSRRHSARVTTQRPDAPGGRNNLRGPLGDLTALSIGGSCDDVGGRIAEGGGGIGRGLNLAVAVPPRPSLSRPGSGVGPALIVGSRPSSHCSSRPSSAASSCASSRPSSAASSHLRGAPTPGRAPVSQRHLIAQYDGIVSTVLPGCDGRSGGRLLLGAEQTARDEALLRDSGVTHIVNCAGLACANHHPLAFAYLKLNLQDTAREDISAAFYDALDFIDDAIGAADSNGCVFVHCQHGVSRSATIVIAYLMWRMRLSYDEALDAVRLTRPTINPNIGFACALLQWGAAILEPPTSLQLWAVQTASATDGATPLAEASTTGAGSGLAMRSVLLPNALQPALCGVAPDGDEPIDEASLVACRAEVADEFKRLGHGCMVLLVGQTAATWLSASAPAAATAEAQRLLFRLVKYHHLPEACSAPPLEHEGSESWEFWSLLRPATARAAMHESAFASNSYASNSLDASSLDAVAEVVEAVRDVSMHADDGVTDDPSLPPQTCTRAARSQKRGFGPPTHAALGPVPSLPLAHGAESAALGPPSFIVPAILTPGSTERSVSSDAPMPPAAGTAGASGSMSRAPVRPSPLHSAHSANDLGESMVLAVLQTVASELLLLLQHEFDLLEPSPSKHIGSQPALADAAGEPTFAEGAGGEEEGVTALHPAHLLTVCQELLLANPASTPPRHAKMRTAHPPCFPCLAADDVRTSHCPPSLCPAPRC